MNSQIDFLNTLREDLERAASRDNPRWGPGKFALPLIVGFGLVSAIAVALWPDSATRTVDELRSTKEPPRTGDHPPGVIPGILPGERGLGAIFDPNQPLMPSGWTTTLAEAAALVDHPLYRPADEGPFEIWVARQEDEMGVWYEAGIRYERPLVLTYSQLPEGADPAEEYERLADEWSAGYATSVNGQPAWVIPDISSGGNLINVVHVSIGRVEVVLFGIMPLDDLLQVSSDLQA